MDKTIEEKILQHTSKIRQKENERMSTMTEDELLNDMIKTNKKVSDYARKHNIKTFKITSDNEKEEV